MRRSHQLMQRWSLQIALTAARGVVATNIVPSFRLTTRQLSDATTQNLLERFSALEQRVSDLVCAAVSSLL